MVENNFSPDIENMGVRKNKSYKLFIIILALVLIFFIIIKFSFPMTGNVVSETSTTSQFDRSIQDLKPVLQTEVLSNKKVIELTAEPVQLTIN